MRIRAAIPQDEGFLADLADEAFSVYGDYRPLLPRWFRAPGVMTWISEDDSGSTGYVMLAFFQDGRHLVGDVLAIAVAPEARGRGIGRLLLQHAISVCEQMADHSPIRAVRLSVAATNTRARNLFTSCGFREVPGDFGTYEGGQQALHTERPIALGA